MYASVLLWREVWPPDNRSFSAKHAASVAFSQWTIWCVILAGEYFFKLKCSAVDTTEPSEMFWPFMGGEVMQIRTFRCMALGSSFWQIFRLFQRPVCRRLAHRACQSFDLTLQYLSAAYAKNQQDCVCEHIQDIRPLVRHRNWLSCSEMSNTSIFPVQHEWDKHGTCALSYTPFGFNSEKEYFETVLQLRSQNDLLVGTDPAYITNSTSFVNAWKTLHFQPGK